MVAAIAATIATVPTAAGAAPANHIVTIADFVFAPAALSVRVGDRITWINKDIVPHTASALDGSWDTGELGPEASGEIGVTAGMSGSYFCAFHPTMTAKLILPRASLGPGMVELGEAEGFPPLKPSQRALLRSPEAPMDLTQAMAIAIRNAVRS